MPEKLPHLVVREASGHEREVEIVRTPFTLGRQGDNDIVFVDVPCVSRHHARIIQNHEVYAIEDLGSLRGTYVNSQRVATTPLKAGDQITLGEDLSAQGVVLTFRYL